MRAISPSLFVLLFLLGIASGSLIRFNLRPAAWLALLFLIGVTFFSRHTNWWYCPALLLSFWLGLLYVTVWRSYFYTVYPLGRDQQWEGIIDEPPDPRSTYTFLTVRLLPGQRGGRIQLKANRYPEWQYGDQIRFSGKLDAPEAFGGFNYPLYLERFHIYGVIWEPSKLRLIAPSRGSPLLSGLYRLRQTVEEKLSRVIPEPENSFLAGILLGSKRAIPAEIQADLRYTGTSHIIAISGANITILLGILLQLLPIYRPKPQFYTTVLIAVFVTLLTGACASVIRGAVVACFNRWLRLFSRQAWPTPFLLCGATLILLGNPLLLIADPGFQLSVAAFAGLSYFGVPFNTYLRNSHLTYRLPELLRGTAAETTAATLGTSFLSFKIFGQLSLLGLIVNPLVLWLLPPITCFGLILIVAPLNLVGSLIKLPLWLLLHTVLAIIQGAARIPVGVIHLNSA